jgi:TnpA family transposase
LYQAFRELELVVRTEFLLRHLNDLDLRRIIQVAMNKSERINQFTHWVGFGGNSDSDILTIRSVPSSRPPWG